MKKLLISTIAAGLMLSACASNKSAEENQAPQQMSVEEAKQQCQQAGGAGQDSATFDACIRSRTSCSRSDSGSGSGYRSGCSG